MQLVRGVPDAWNVADFGRDAFEARHGARNVVVFGPAQALVFGGVSSRKMPIAQVLAAMRGENDHVLYVFDDEFFHGAAAADLLDVAEDFEEIAEASGPATCQANPETSLSERKSGTAALEPHKTMTLEPSKTA